MSHTSTPSGPAEPVEPESRWLNAGDDFDAFYRKIFRPLVGHAIVAGCPPHQAPEVVQEVLLKLSRRWATLDVAGRTKYAKVSVVNAVIDLQRRNRRRREVPVEDIEDTARTHPVPSPVERSALDKTEADRAYRYIMTQLSAQARQAILLKADGYDTAEIAQVMGIDQSTARSHLHRARTLVKNYLEGRSR